MAANPLRSEFHEEMSVAIHDLCQPLTTLRCRLELAMMQRDPEKPDPDELREAILSGLDDLKRIFQLVDRLRQSVLAETKRQPFVRSHSK